MRRPHRNDGRSRPSVALLLVAAVTIPVLVAGFVVQALGIVYPRTLMPVAGAVAPITLVAAPLALLLLALALIEVHRGSRRVGRMTLEARRTLGELAAIVDTADDAIIALDADDRIVRWNPGAQRLYGVSAADAMGRPFTDFLAAEAVDDVRATLRTVSESCSRRRSQARHLRADGSSFDASAAWSAVVDADGHPLGVSVIVRDVTERNLAVGRLAASERRLSLVTGSANEAILTTDDHGRIVEWNPAATRIFGWTDPPSTPRSIGEVLVRPGADPTRSGRTGLGVDALRCLAGQTVEVRGVRGSGEAFPAELSVAVFEDEDRTWYTTFVRDATARVQAERQARELAERYQYLVEHVPGVVYRAPVGSRAVVDYVSPHVETLLGYTPEEWISSPGRWESCIHPDDLPDVLAAEQDEGTERSIEYRMTRRDGRVIWVRDQAGIVAGPGEAASWSGILIDITDRKDLEGQLLKQAFHDPLTGLANRALFADRIEHALRRTEREPGYVGLLMIDIDDFKTVNDTLGHEAGDQLLQAIATRLREQSRSGSTIARLGGDEFAILLEDLEADDAAVAAAQRIIRGFERPFRVGSNTLTARASIGVVVDSMRRRSAEWMLRSADVAMYEAKKRGKGTWRLYDPASYLAATKRVVLESELRRAVERKHFTLLYQPIVDLRQGIMTGVEALIRWEHPTRGLVPPLAFISVLESTGLIVPVGEWVLQTACRQAAEWTERFPALRSMAVNASVRQIGDPSFGQAVINAVRSSGIDPSLLLLEVTESVALDTTGGGRERLRWLRAGGVRVAIDDFGTGYSSLSYLRDLPVDTIKIDRSFIAGVGEEEEATAVARAILSLAGTLHLQTVAEGIETPTQAGTLRSLGCDLGQGFLFARPMPASGVAIRFEHQQAVPRSA